MAMAITRVVLLLAALCIGAAVAAANDATETEAAIARFPRIVPDEHAPEGAFPTPPKRHHVVLATIPMYGHFMPVKAFGEALLSRGHDVTLMTEKPSWCETPLARKFECVVMPPSGMFPPSVLERITLEDNYDTSFFDCLLEVASHHGNASQVFIDTIRRIHAAKPVTGVITDASTIAGFDAAAAVGAPVVSSFPMQLHLPVEPTASLPSPGAGNSRWMPLWKRVLNFAVKVLVVPPAVLVYLYRFNAVRTANGIAPFRNIFDMQGYYAPILAPAVWGHDMPQALCPNVFPLGTLVPAVEHIPLEPALSALLDSERCKANGALYINFGTLTQLTDRLRDALIEVVTAPGFEACVVWKPNPKHLDTVTTALTQGIGADRVFVAKYLANPPAIMAHPNVRLFLTHCGDTSVGEAMEAEVPLAGIPQFADQPDVCQRITEGGFGQYLGHKSHVTAAELSASIGDILTNGTRRGLMKAAYARTRASRKFLGGAQRGAQIAEAHFDYALGDQLYCAHIDPVRLGTVDPVTGKVDERLWVQAWAMVQIFNLDVLLLFSVIPTAIALKLSMLLARCVIGALWRAVRGTPAAKSKQD